ncbi:hypothetical protein SAMN05720354_11858 [Nitrosospira sp. Nsp1]|nr:hypothetical protein SAMN05720354_11858 [Nitrosospira sp. Nsp1]
MFPYGCWSYRSKISWTCWLYVWRFSVNTVSSRENAPLKDVSAFMNASNLGMADWWEPTPENYFRTCPKTGFLRWWERWFTLK